jgi:predicted TIM-barrel fold metal-dependent hydrolase
VVDADGHQLELEPVMFDYLREVAGSSYPDAARKTITDILGWYDQTPAERLRYRTFRPAWGLQATNPDDIAACMAPALMRQRMDQIGIDFAIIYPTLGFPIVRKAAPELRSAVYRAVNKYYADLFAGVQDRMTPAAFIPMSSPEEAVAELDYAVETLGFKVVVIDCAVPRPVPELASLIPTVPAPVARFLCWLDTFGLDSEHDYDPFWRRCVELGISPTAHQGGLWGTRTSPSNYVHNHLGMFGAGAEALCKSLFLGGVTFRFPELRFGLLEGGAGWACSLYSDLVEHWERRNREAVEVYNPSHLDPGRIMELLREYGGERMRGHLDKPFEELFPGLFRLSGWIPQAGWDPRDPAMLDEFSHCRIEREEDIGDHFVPNFYFGCEAEDPSVGWALEGRRLPGGAKLRVMFGSDIGHWDVTDMTQVLAEAYKSVEDGNLSEEDFKLFAFENAVLLHGLSNPGFFRGTPVESEAAALLERAR